MLKSKHFENAAVRHAGVTVPSQQVRRIVNRAAWTEEAFCVPIYASASRFEPARARCAIFTNTLQRAVLATTREESFRAASIDQDGVDYDSLAVDFVSAGGARHMFGLSRFTIRRLLHHTSATPVPTPPNSQTPRYA